MSARSASRTIGPYAKPADVLRPEDAPYNAAGNGVADDFAAVKACFDAANALRHQVGTYGEPGAAVQLRGTYKLTSQNAPIDVMCDVDSVGATFTTPAGYTGTAVRVGHTTAGYTMQNMDVTLPSVIGASVVGVGSLPSGSVGVLIRNVYSSAITVAKNAYFETTLKVGGESWGVAYCDIKWRTLTFGKIMLALQNLDSGGWSNQNVFTAGSITGSTVFSGRRATGSRAVLLDGSTSTSITGNTFVGCSFESDVYDYVVEFNTAYQNQFLGCRHEQGIAAAAVTVSGDTITSNSHVMAVDDMVTFTGTTAATGMSFDQPYFVTAATANTFKVAASRGGSTITFTSSGTSVAYLRPQRVKYIQANDNVIDLPMTPVRWLDRVYGAGVTAALAGNEVRYGQQRTTDGYAPPSWPLRRVRNRFTNIASTRAALDAYYPPTIDPVTAPDGWTYGASATGPVWPSAVCVISGTGSPNTVYSAPIGSLYLQSDNDGSIVVWYKATGTSTTGWVSNVPGGDLLTTGEFIPNRDLPVSGSVSHTTQTQAMAFFTARRTETINTLTFYTGTTAAAATPTLIRYGVWSVDAAGAGTLVASTANDTTLLAATNTPYPKALSAAWSKTAGQRYAVGVLVVSSTTMPSYIGQVFAGTATGLAFLGESPRQTGRLTGVSDLTNFADASLVVVQGKTAVKMS